MSVLSPLAAQATSCNATKAVAPWLDKRRQPYDRKASSLRKAEQGSDLSVFSRRSLLWLLGSLPVARPRAAESSSSVPLDLRYVVEVSGIKIAELALAITPEGSTTRSQLALRSLGLASLWSDAWSKLSAISATGATAPPRPSQFEAYQHKRDRIREIAIRYDNRGDIGDLEVKSQGRVRESEVPKELRHATMDPLTALLRLRRWVSAAAEGSAERSLTIPVFDGRKRLDILASFIGTTRTPQGPVHELDVQLRGLSGFEPDDWFVSVPGDAAPEIVRVVVSADERLAPLSIRAMNDFAGTVITLAADCRAQPGCRDLVP